MLLDAGFLQAFRDVFRDRADVPVGPARGDDHVVGKCGFAAKVDGDRFFRLHIVEAGEDHIQRLVGVGLRLQGRSLVDVLRAVLQLCQLTLGKTDLDNTDVARDHSFHCIANAES